ncbi:MAG: NnrU family protein [Gammaproteobacteria bacterium]|nr:NnrU family protein [Gammaproteobacteria bacterium]
MTELLIAAALWIATHLGISSTALRARAVGAIGEGAYLGAYSLLAVATLTFLILAWADAPRDIWLWYPAVWQTWLALLLMPLAFVLLVSGLLGPNPTSVGQERRLADPDTVRGVLRITRHPVQWAFLLWALAHAPANGELATLILLGSIAIVAGFGTVLIDRKKAAAAGDDWQNFAAVTSNLPFAAIVAGRNRLAFGELGVGKLLLGLLIYGLVIASHRWIAGVPIVI